MQCLENMHVSSLEEFSWDAEGGESKKQTMLEALNRFSSHPSLPPSLPPSTVSTLHLLYYLSTLTIKKNRRCKHHKSCSLSPSSSYSAARLVWTCTENSLLSRTTYYWVYSPLISLPLSVTLFFITINYYLILSSTLLLFYSLLILSRQ